MFGIARDRLGLPFTPRLEEFQVRIPDPQAAILGALALSHHQLSRVEVEVAPLEIDRL